MVRSLKVSKGSYPVQLIIDEQGLRIEGDLNAAKKCKKKTINISFLLFLRIILAKSTRTVCCIPVPVGNGPDPTLLPIDNVFITNAYYQERTKMIHIDCVLPEDRTVEESPADIYRFIYSVENADDATSFCKELMSNVYQDLKFGKRLLVLINPFGGRGKAKEIFEYYVRPIFESAKCTIQVKCKSL